MVTIPGLVFVADIEYQMIIKKAEPTVRKFINIKK